MGSLIRKARESELGRLCEIADERLGAQVVGEWGRPLPTMEIAP